MNVFDWIFIAALVLGLVLGLLKGFLKPLFSAIGFIVIAFGSSALTPVVQGWLMNVEMTDNLRPLLSLIIAVIGLIIVWALISFILRKIITRRKGMSVINRVIGAVLGVLIVYLVFAVVTAFMMSTLGTAIDRNGTLVPEVEASWIYNHIYTEEANFFGNWIIGDMMDRIEKMIQGAPSDAQSLAVISTVLSIKK